MRITGLVAIGTTIGLFLGPGSAALGQQSMHGGHHGASAGTEKKAPVRMTMEELHKHGGVPPGWTFTLPPGDVHGGRQAYIALKCYTCHDIAGETFPAHTRDVGDVGPDLSGMGAHHPAEYFAEAILSPNAVVVLGEGYTGSDGLSRMPDYNDTLTVKQLIDLVAYLKSLTGAPSSPMRHGGDKGHGHPGPSHQR